MTLKKRKRKIQILITEKTILQHLLEEKIKLTLRNIRLDENKQSEKRRIIGKVSDQVRINATVKDAEIIIHIELGHYLETQNARPIPLHFEEEVSKELKKLKKPDI